MVYIGKCVGLQESGLKHIFRSHMIIQRTCGYEQGGAKSCLYADGCRLDRYRINTAMMTPILHCTATDLKRGKNDILPWGMHISVN